MTLIWGLPHLDLKFHDFLKIKFLPRIPDNYTFKIKNVYYAKEDPDARTFRKAKKFLNSNGIKSKLINSKKFNKFYKSYFYNKKFLMPYVSAKIAISKDFFTINKHKTRPFFFVIDFLLLI